MNNTSGRVAPAPQDAQRPNALHVEMNSVYPRWPCYVHDGIGTANGGFWKGFRTHSAMWAWLTKHGYTLPGAHLHA